jgi:aminoglycoside phosphotransferase (APT) family kinase protein
VFSSPSTLWITPSQRLRSRWRTKREAREERAASDVLVSEQLLRTIAVPGLRYREQPTAFHGGWETYTYHLEFEPHPDLPQGFNGPLALRIYATEHGAVRARHEFSVQLFLHGHGFPVPRPALLVDDGEAFGGPFLLMERVPGRPVFDVLQTRPWMIWKLAAEMARLQARLHQLPPDGFPDDRGDFLDRSLETLRARIVAYGLQGLRPGLDWLTANRPRRTGIPRPLHLDWHPLNLIRSTDEMSAIDWNEATVGDRHADVATTLVALECLPLPPVAAWQRPFASAARGVLRRHYLRVYNRRLPLDPERLTYYGGWAVLQRLGRYGKWLSAGPGCTGFKASMLRRITPAHCQVLSDYFARQTGVEVKLECDAW